MRTRKKIKKIIDNDVVSNCSDDIRIIAKYRAKINNPLTAIRAHCVECMGGGIHEITHCTSIDCALYPLRMGKNVFDHRVKKRLEKEND